MSLPNPAVPVIISASKTLSVSLDNFTRRMCIVSEGGTDLTAGEYVTVTKSDYSSKISQTESTGLDELTRKLVGFFSYAASSEVVILEVGASSESNTPTEQCAILQNFITTENPRCYVHLCPDDWYSDTNTALADLAKQYTSETAAVYFMVKTNADEDPTTSAAFSAMSNVKSIMGVYPNVTNSSADFTGMVLGIMAGSDFDISDSNPASPLNYKAINGQTIESLSSSMQSALATAPVTFGLDIASNQVVANGRYTSGDTFDYWYQFDLLCIRLQEKIVSLLINGSNNPNFAVRYNQDGIDMLAAGIKGILNKAVSQGLLTTFAADYDSTTGEFEDEGDISATDFYTYKEDNPENYNEEKYDGFSFYIMIGRYIKEVTLNITVD